MADIKERALANGTFMLAPNGRQSNLSEQQWLQVRTKAFKDWFGDWINDPANASKVLDENGEPLVVYHYTNSDFSSFNRDLVGKNWRESSEYGKDAFFFLSEKDDNREWGKNEIPVFFVLFKKYAIIYAKSLKIVIKEVLNDRC